MNLKEIQKTTKSLKLLYVEDDTKAQNATVELLSNFFSNITVCSNGEEGLEQFYEHHFDMVLSDINMPKLSGLEMVTSIRKIDQNIPIIFLTAHNENSFLTQGISLNIDGYLLKPLHLNNFIILLGKISKKISLQKQSENYKITLEHEVKKQTEILHYKLYHDELTSLYNRHSFSEDLQKKEHPLIFIIDINKFKVINEIYGTDIGSYVLLSFSKFLKRYIQNTNCKIYRISGDEFAVLNDNSKIKANQLEKKVSNFLNAMKQFKVELENDTLSIEVTIGVSASKIDTFETAKIALEHAKQYKKQYEVYTPKLNKREEEHDALVWKEKTKSAIEENRIVTVYQPIVDKEKNILKYETLIRLHDKETDTLITPNYFLDTAMKTGLYYQLSSFVIFNTLNFLKESQETLSINFSYTDILHDNLLEKIENFLILNKEIGKRVIFEILENENIADYTVLTNFIKRFRKFGVKFAIDDFGSGYSNFSYLLKLKPDYIKIDGSLIKNINNSKTSYSIVKSISLLANELNLEVVSEFIDNEGVLESLKILKISQGQGFYLGKPKDTIEI